MKKTLLTSLAVAVVGSLMMAGSAMALPSEWGIINPQPLAGTPVPMTGGTGPSYFIWTDDIERTDWHIRWTGNNVTPVEVFSGTIAFENNTGSFSEFSFESVDSSTFFSSSAIFTAKATTGFDGIDFTINQTAAPSYVGFDLFVNGLGADATKIFLGMNSITVASLGQDQDFAIAAPVPEPATMLLLGTGLVGLASARRRKAAKKA